MLSIVKRLNRGKERPNLSLKRTANCVAEKLLTEMVWGKQWYFGTEADLNCVAFPASCYLWVQPSFQITIANQNSVLKSVIFLINLPERSKLTAQGIVLDSRNYSSKKYRGKLRTKNLWLFVLFAH